MKFRIFTLVLLAVCSVGVAADPEHEFRDFTGANGKVIQAVLIDKDGDKATLLLKSGGRTTIPVDKLSEADQAFVKAWSRDKAIFLQKCRGLSVRALLELRGYELIPLRFENNSIHVEGTVNGEKAEFLIDTGAGTSLIHTSLAERSGCKVGPMTEKIYGVAGEAPAGWTEVNEFQLGESVFKAHNILATDMRLGLQEGQKLKHEVLFGADLLSKLDAVISYKERMMFLRPDLSDQSEIEDVAAGEDDKLRFRIFKFKDGRVLRGSVLSKTTTAVKLSLAKGGEEQVSISRLSAEDQTYVRNWSEAGDLFLRYCGSLKIEELLELRKYQSFQYERRGNHIFVDGTLNTRPVTWMIDTGADNSLLHLFAAEESKCEVGPMDQKVFGIGGTAPAAVTRIGELTMGEAKFTNRKVLATDLARFRDDDQLGYAGLFGADFMRELEAVITYRESRVFLRQ